MKTATTRTATGRRMTRSRRMLRGRRRMLRGRRMPPRRRRMPGGVAATVKLCIKITARAWVGGGWSKTQRIHYVGDARLLPRI
jgi:hypothetical protein